MSAKFRYNTDREAAAGIIFSIPLMRLAGIILFAHSTMDRVMGFGLKYSSGFGDNHLA